MERWGETDLLVGKREKENVIMNGEREKNQALLLFLCFLQGEEDVAGKNGKDTETGRK